MAAYYEPSEKEIAAAAEAIKEANVKAMFGKPSPRSPGPSVREVALADCGIVGVRGIGYAAGLPDWSEAENEWGRVRREKQKHDQKRKGE